MVVVKMEPFDLCETEHGLSDFCKPILEEIEHLELFTDFQTMFWHEIFLILALRSLFIDLN